MATEFIDEVQSSERETVSIREVLERSVAVDESGNRLVLPDSSSLEKAMHDKRLKLYLGIDPTSPELHIGHTVPLRKLRQFQDLGHEVVLLFGTFTGMIGDPTDKSATRVKLTNEQIETNIASYKEQAGKILDLSKKAKNPITIVHNDEWLRPINFEGVVDLASNFTVQQMLERSMFKDRIKDGKPVYLHEFLYPLMQGQDSVSMNVDIEVGGKDQVFNMLVGRELVKRYLGKEKWVLATKLIEDPNGKKMGKTEGNIVNIRDFPEVIYEGIMTWPDSAIPMGFELITTVPMEKVHIVSEMLQAGKLDPVVTKEALAYRVVAELHGEKEASIAKEEFTRVKRQGMLPRRMNEVSIGPGTKISEILLSSGLVKTSEEAAMKIAQKSIFIDGKQSQKDTAWPASAETISLGKKTIKNIRRVVTT
jgi:tyrosyl-tRNA synthetase